MAIREFYEKGPLPGITPSPFTNNKKNTDGCQVNDVDWYRHMVKRVLFLMGFFQDFQGAVCPSLAKQRV